MTSDDTLAPAADRGDTGRSRSGQREKIALSRDTTPWYVYAAIIGFGVLAPTAVHSTTVLP